MSLAVFGYASLVDPASAAETIGRPVEASDPVRLRGWRRRWSQVRNNHRVEKTFAPASGDGAIEWCLGLNLEPEDGAAGPNGVLIELASEEAERLDLREARYRRVDVTEGIHPAPGFDRVFAYVAREEHLASGPPRPGTAIIAAHLETVERAFERLGPGELELFRETTGPPPVDPVAAVLLADDRIPRGNPRSW